MRVSSKYFSATCAVIAIAMGCSSSLYAQTDAAAQAADDDTSIGDIIVTAQKSEEKLSRAPLAVTALTGDALAKNHITDAASLAASVPSMNFGMYGGTARLAIRGVGFNSINAGAEGRVAYYTDGIYFSRPATALSGFYDVARVEILRGPQGTLYGRNATGGALNVITAEPTSDLSGYFTQTVGNYNLFTEEGAISGPLSDKVSARLAVKIVNRDGYGKNYGTGNDVDNAATQSIRAKLKFEPTAETTITAAFDYHHENDRNYGGHYGGQAYPAVFPVMLSTLLTRAQLGGPIPPTVRDYDSLIDPSNRRTFYGASLTVAHDLSFGTVKSITAYRHSNYTDKYADGTGDATPLTNAEKSDQISQELQLSGDSDTFKWVGGLYYFHERINGHVDIPLGVDLLNLLGLGPIPASPNGYVHGYWAGGIGKTDTVAGYGQVTWKITPELELTGGVRYAWERHKVKDSVQFDFSAMTTPNPLSSALFTPAPRSDSEKSFTPKATLSYLFAPDSTVYFTVAKGYKSGGFDLGATQAVAYNPEKLWDYEGGIKTRLFGGRVQANLAAFYYDYSNLQVSVIVGNIVNTKNAAKARTYGFEGEIQAILAPGLRLDMNGSYLNAKFKDFRTVNTDLQSGPVNQYAGNTLPQSPKWQGQAGLEYTYDLANGASLRFRGDVNYTSRIHFSPFNIDTISQGEYTKFDGSIDYIGASDKWQVGVYVKNITDKTTTASAVANSFLASNSLLSYYDPPRTYGAYVTVRF
ncbi:TonB-dependent receptor [Sphingobium subterraneum]|uniref:Iron complex outermembrane receptor protein n=1 Tax=Sphingobium subterraneum TaxID=627688 RepID=A0A841IUM5_9SPHN|nr:TonB-dependent receptor [Sphingobium subterraneum]MBB6122387.1 iron complex outermembrane receptor protein [Sphingobium subterraneum]